MFLDVFTLGHGGGDLLRLLPALPPPDPRDPQVLPVLHSRLQDHLHHQERGDRRPGQQNEYRYINIIITIIIIIIIFIIIIIIIIIY